MKKTLVINIIGGPGTGKTTVAADLFSKLKREGFDVENVSEFAKELVWEDNSQAFKDRLYMHAVQNHRLFEMNNKLDYIITDSPLLLTSVYNSFYLKNEHSSSYNSMIDLVVEETWNQYNNVTYLLERETEYNGIGRRENSKDAKIIDEKIKEYLEKHNIKYKVVKLEEAANIIFNDIVNNK